MERLINTYLHLPVEQTKTMEYGLQKDREWKEYILSNKKMPQELGGEKHAGITVIPAGSFVLADDVHVSYEMDAISLDGIIELKCSWTMDSADYASKDQIWFYFLALLMDKKLEKYSQVNRGIVYCYHPITRTYDRTIVYSSPKKLSVLAEYIKESGRQIRDYLAGEGIL